MQVEVVGYMGRCSSNEETLRHNLCSLYVVMMSQWDATMEDKEMTHEGYLEIKRTRDTLKIMQVTKQYLFCNAKMLQNI